MRMRRTISGILAVLVFSLMLIFSGYLQFHHVCSDVNCSLGQIHRILKHSSSSKTLIFNPLEEHPDLYNHVCPVASSGGARFLGLEPLFKATETVFTIGLFIPFTYYTPPFILKTNPRGPPVA